MRDARGAPDGERSFASNYNTLLSFLEKHLNPLIDFSADAKIFKLIEYYVVVSFVERLAVVKVNRVDRFVVLQQQDYRFIILNKIGESGPS